MLCNYLEGMVYTTEIRTRDYRLDSRESVQPTVAVSMWLINFHFQT